MFEMVVCSEALEMLSNWKNIIKLKFGSTTVKSKSLQFILIVFLVLFIIFYVFISLKDTGSLDFRYIFSYWIDSFSLKKLTVFIKDFQIVRLFSVLLNLFLVLIVFLSVKNQLGVFFSRVWQHTVSVFKFISKKLVEFLKIDSIYWLSAIPVLYILSYVIKVHSIPNNDYWNLFFLPVLNSSNLLGFIKALFFKVNNEHLILLPRVIFLLNYIISKGDNRYLFLTNIIINLLSFNLLATLFSKEKFFPKKHLWLLWLLTSIMLFSPNMSHNWIRSMSGVMWFLANLFFIASLTYAQRVLAYQKDKQKYFKLLSVFTILAFLTYSSSLVIPPVVIFYLLLNIRSWKDYRKVVFQYLFLSVLIYLLWFLFWYEKPSIHPDLTFKFLDNVGFIKVYIGSGFSENLKTAKIYGNIGLILFSLCSAILLYFFTNNCRRKLLSLLSFFYSFTLYAFINILLTVISRSGDKEIQYIMYIERYINISNFFWLGVILFIFSFVVLVAENNKTNITSVCLNIFICICFFFIFLPSYVFGIINTGAMNEVFVRAEEPFKLSMKTEVYDSDVFRTFMTWGDYSVFKGIINTRIYKKYNSFNSQKLDFSYNVKVSNPENFNKNVLTKKIFGAIDKYESLNRDHENINLYYDNKLLLEKERYRKNDYKITGWVCMLFEKLDNMLILDDSDKMWGAGVVFEERLDIGGLYGEECLVSGFVAYIREPVPGAKYSIFLTDSDSKGYYFQDVVIPIE